MPPPSSKVAAQVNGPGGERPSATGPRSSRQQNGTTIRTAPSGQGLAQLIQQNVNKASAAAGKVGGIVLDPRSAPKQLEQDAPAALPAPAPAPPPAPPPQPKRPAGKPMKKLMSIAVSKGGLKNINRKTLVEQNIFVHPLTLFPYDPWYLAWWSITVIAAALTGAFVPLEFAFAAQPGLGPYNDLFAGVAYVLMIVFFIDMGVQCFVARHEYSQHHLVIDLHSIRMIYFKKMFWWDLVSTIPWDYIVMGAAGYQSAESPGLDGSTTPSWIAILKWLKMIRLYRLIELFTTHLEYNLNVSQLTITLIRNHVYIAILLHSSACWFFWVARIKGFSDDTWVGNSYQLVVTQGPVAEYLYSLYFCVTTFATVGYGDIHAFTVPEILCVMLTMLVNLVVSAYILGTITSLVIGADERMKEYRQAMGELENYGRTHNIPERLLEVMRSHLETSLDESRAAEDEDILGVHSGIVRRRVLRHLYLPIIEDCYLFRGCPGKMLNAVLTSARVERHLPQMDILSEGDMANELCILVEGTVNVLPSAAALEQQKAAAAAGMKPSAPQASLGVSRTVSHQLSTEVDLHMMEGQGPDQRQSLQKAPISSSGVLPSIAASGKLRSGMGPVAEGSEQPFLLTHSSTVVEECSTDGSVYGDEERNSNASSSSSSGEGAGDLDGTQRHGYQYHEPSVDHQQPAEYDAELSDRLGSHAHAGPRQQQQLQQPTWAQRALRALGWSRSHRVHHNHHQHSSGSSWQHGWAEQIEAHNSGSGSQGDGSPWWQAAERYLSISATIHTHSTDPEAACVAPGTQHHHHHHSSSRSGAWRLPAQAVGEAATDAGARFIGQGVAMDPFQVHAAFEERQRQEAEALRRYKENNPLLASKPSTEAPAPPKRRAAPIYVEEDEDAGKPQPRTLKPGDTFGEVSFFTEFPMQETVIANEVCRVLIVPRDIWQAILLDNPDGAKLVLANLQGFFQAKLREEIQAAKKARAAAKDTLHAIHHVTDGDGDGRKKTKRKKSKKYKEADESLPPLVTNKAPSPQSPSTPMASAQALYSGADTAHDAQQHAGHQQQQREALHVPGYLLQRPQHTPSPLRQEGRPGSHTESPPQQQQHHQGYMHQGHASSPHVQARTAPQLVVGDQGGGVLQERVSLGGGVERLRPAVPLRLKEGGRLSQSGGSTPGGAVGSTGPSNLSGRLDAQATAASSTGPGTTPQPPSSVPARLLSRKGSARLSGSSTSIPGTPMPEGQGESGFEFASPEGATAPDQQLGGDELPPGQEPLVLGQPSPSVVEERWGRAEDLTESIKRRNVMAWPALGSQQPGTEGAPGSHQQQQESQSLQGTPQQQQQQQPPLTGLAALLAKQKQEQQQQEASSQAAAAGTGGDPLPPQTPLAAGPLDPRTAPDQLPTAFGSLAAGDSSGAATKFTVPPLQGQDSHHHQHQQHQEDSVDTNSVGVQHRSHTDALEAAAGSGHSLAARKSVSIKARSRPGQGHLIEGGGSSGAAPHSPHHTGGGHTSAVHDDGSLSDLTQRTKSRSNMLRPVNVAPNPALAATRAGSRAPSRMGSFTANPAARQAILQQLGRADHGSQAPHSPSAAGAPPSAAVVRWKLAGVATGVSADTMRDPQPSSPSHHYADEQEQPTAKATVKPKVKQSKSMPRVTEEDAELDMAGLAMLGPAAAALLKSADRIKSTVQEYSTKVESVTAGEIIASAARGDVAKLKKAIEAGNDLNTVDDHGKTALMAACARGQAEAARALLDARADPSIRDPNGWTALFEACRGGHDKIVDMMVEQGMRLTMEPRALLPYMVMAAADDLKLLKRLLKSGADPNLQDTEGRTLLLMAVMHNNAEVAQTLLAAGANPNISDLLGRTPLMVAAARGLALILLDLVEAGADPSRKDYEGRTALYEACRTGGSQAIEVLMVADAQLLMDEKVLGAELVQCAYKQDMKMMRRFLSAGAEPDLQDYSGLTALMVAATKNYADVALVLVEGGATVDCCDDRGRTPLMLAASKGHADTVAVLVSGEADTSGRDLSGSHALLEACLSGHEPTVDLLLEVDAELYLDDAAMFNVLVSTLTAGSLISNHQADPLSQLRLLLKARAEPNVVDHRGQTPLHVAASKGNAGAVAALLNGGAKPFAKDMFGSTPLLEACCMGHDPVITLMVNQRGLKFEAGDRAVANALCLAAADGDVKLVKRLLAAGAHADTPNTDQRTALHVAASAGSLQLCQVLIEEGKATPLVKDRQGALPIDNARLVGAQPVVQFLQNFSPRVILPPPPAAVVPVVPEKDYSIPALPAPTEATGATHSALAKVMSRMTSVKPGG